MTASAIVFYVLASLCVVSAVMVVTRKSAIHAALFLVLAFFCVAGIYVILSAEFLAAVQVLVYAGGVMVLFLFVVRTRREAAVHQICASSLSSRDLDLHGEAFHVEVEALAQLLGFSAEVFAQVVNDLAVLPALVTLEMRLDLAAR